MEKRLFVLTLALLSMGMLFVSPPVLASDFETTTILFWGEGCPHCNEEKAFLEEMEAKYPAFHADLYEVWYNSTNRELFEEFAECYRGSTQGVPVLIIDEQYVSGYSSAYASDLEAKIYDCIQNGCSDPYLKLDEYNQSQTCEETNETVQEDIELPFIGKIDANEMSLPVLAVVMGFLDGFNPCAFFVLFFLLGMLVYAGSRKRMLLIGGIFVFFSGLIYLLFMAAWLSFFQIAGNLTIVTSIAGIVALVIGLVNVKDFFFFKKGVSFSMSDTNRSKLAKRMRNLLKVDSLPSLIAATVVLAVAANSYELLCTAGFPMVFTRILTLNNLSTVEYAMYLVLYNMVYIIPLLTIVLIFTYYMGTRKLTQEQGEALKLMSGLMMLLLGILLLVKPALLTNVYATILILGFAVLLAVILILAKKYILKKRSNVMGADAQQGVKNEI